MQNELFEKEVKKYSQMTDEQLAREFVITDYRVNELWSDIDDMTADRRELIASIIQERFVKKHTGVEWNDDVRNWNVKLSFAVV